MGTEWKDAIDSLTSVTITANSNNELVTTKGVPDDLRCIGIGTDAAVFIYLKAPGYAFKKYAKEKIDKVKIEEKVYHMLGNSPYFSKCYGSYDDFLVLSFEEGITLYDCILQGIHIPQQVILDVEDAREHARSKGLNPRDIHLKNILLQNGRAKIIDVSEYLKPGNDYRWELLKKGYEQYYPLIDGKPVPFWIVEMFRKLYQQRNIT